MKGSFNAPFFYAEYTLDLTVKLARILRRWQLGVACLDTSRRRFAPPKTSTRLQLNQPAEIRKTGSDDGAVFAAEPLGESPLIPFTRFFRF